MDTQYTFLRKTNYKALYVLFSQSKICIIRTFHFILSYFNTKTLSAKKENRKTIAIQINIYLHIKSYEFAGLPMDRASGRMLVFQEFLQFPFENGDCGTHSDF